MSKEIILLLIPILLIQLILTIINLINISKKNKTKYLNKNIWILIILLCSLIGNITYMIVEGDHYDSD